nr:hypothetical protein B0A51_05493 [Rachicladosporium sp. CCFEE 5018]
MFLVPRAARLAWTCRAGHATRSRFLSARGRQSVPRSHKPDLPVFRAPIKVEVKPRVAPRVRFKELLQDEFNGQHQSTPQEAAGAAILAVGIVLVFILSTNIRHQFTRLETVEITGRRRYSGEADPRRLARKLPLENVVRRHAAMMTYGGRSEPVEGEMIDGLLPCDHSLVAHAQGILDELAAVAGLNIELTVVNVANDCGCYATDNAHIRAGAGFFRILKDDAETAAAFAHAVAQVVAGHPREVQNRSLMMCRFEHGIGSSVLSATSIGMTGFGLAGLMFTKTHKWGAIGNLVFGTVIGIPLIAVTISHQRNEKARAREADYLGMLLLVGAGYDPDAMVTYWGSLASRRAQLHEDFTSELGANKVPKSKHWAEFRKLTSAQSLEGLKSATLARAIVAAATTEQENTQYVELLSKPENLDKLWRWATFRNTVTAGKVLEVEA